MATFRMHPSWRIFINDVEISGLVRSVTINSVVGSLTETRLDLIGAPETYQDERGDYIVRFTGEQREPPPRPTAAPQPSARGIRLRDEIPWPEAQ